ncbi:hypothetical protein GQ55_7G024000 [Panicum hallii var. hallii]|uniref:Rx N-terminal domain-containing protein n=1 Tax=Panicum hallii var. hallii TaxID=1504633 RepID=A0A2T7CS24_9POAL|nr:hypothetical protein GQ55_7G024000 [Panicum hallii var. hallii]
MAELAAVGWAMSALGWIASPITTRLLNDGFALLRFVESEKLRDLEARLLPQLALMLEKTERIPTGQMPHLWAKRLRAAFYDAEDILNVADYHHLENQKSLEFPKISLESPNIGVSCGMCPEYIHVRSLQTSLQSLEVLFGVSQEFF